MIRIDSNIEDVTRRLAALPRKVKPVLKKASKRAAVSTRKRIMDIVRSKYAIKASDLRGGLVRMRQVGLGARVDISGRPLSAMLFRPRQVSTGVALTIESGQRTTIRSAFIAVMPSGHEGIFKRVGKARLPIRELLGPSVPTMLQSAGVPVEAIVTFAANKLEQNVSRAIDYELERL